MRKIIFCLIFIISFFTPIYLFFFLETIFGAVLFSEGFESSDLSSWSSSGGGAAAIISEEIFHGGSKSIKIQHSKTASYGFQTVIQNIEGGMFYDVSGYGNSTDSGTAAFFIRLAWYSSTD
ncbi:MAG: carbohydrate binding domain-containing protein, partial [Candidatus Woesebacteria bacterium]|nr:carbohydrate binding domain-containing protein [Candidatus Woesebacteria bacterium]